MKKLNLRKKQGITLIALVVTIVVLLILAAVSIGMLTGENGVITQAQRAKEETVIADEKEILSLSYTTCKQDNMINDMAEEIVTDEQLQIELNNNKRNTTVTLVGEDLEVIFTDTNHKYVIYQNGTIEQVENLSPEEANKIVDVVASNRENIYVLTAEGKVKKANIIEGNMFDTLEVAENAETITRNGVRKKGDNYFIDNQGKVYTWGDNSDGQLGDGTDVYYSNEPKCISDIPGNALNGKNIIDVVWNGETVVALDDQGKVYTWGDNEYGQLGDGTDVYYSNEPKCISDIAGNLLNGKKITDISNNGYTIIVLDDQGKVYTWGGMLGNGTMDMSSVPICISDINENQLNGKNITEIYSAGYGSMIIALDDQGKVYTWGTNEYGQLGNGTYEEYSLSPICISDISGNALNGKKIIDVVLDETVVALDDQGKIYTWGDNYGGQLGDGTDVEYSNEPICISDISESELKGKKITNIYNAEGTIIALSNEGELYTWGDNYGGKLGNGTDIEYSNKPICITSSSDALRGKTILNVAVVYNKCFPIIALDKEGNAYIWGIVGINTPYCVNENMDKENINKIGILKNDYIMYFISENGNAYIGYAPRP